MVNKMVKPKDGSIDVFDPDLEFIDNINNNTYSDRGNMDYDRVVFSEEELSKSMSLALELSEKISKLERIFDRNNRYITALNKVEHAIRYLNGFLKDYSITTKKELYKDRIVVTIEIKPYDKLNEYNEIKAKLVEEIRAVFPDADDEKIEQLVNNILKPPV